MNTAVYLQTGNQLMCGGPTLSVFVHNSYANPCCSPVLPHHSSRAASSCWAYSSFLFSSVVNSLDFCRSKMECDRKEQQQEDLINLWPQGGTSLYLMKRNADLLISTKCGFFLLTVCLKPVRAVCVYLETL